MLEVHDGRPAHFCSVADVHAHVPDVCLRLDLHSREARASTERRAPGTQTGTRNAARPRSTARGAGGGRTRTWMWPGGIFAGFFSSFARRTTLPAAGAARHGRRERGRARVARGRAGARACAAEHAHGSLRIPGRRGGGAENLTLTWSSVLFTLSCRPEPGRSSLLLIVSIPARA